MLVRSSKTATLIVDVGRRRQCRHTLSNSPCHFGVVANVRGKKLGGKPRQLLKESRRYPYRANRKKAAAIRIGNWAVEIKKNVRERYGSFLSRFRTKHFSI